MCNDVTICSPPPREFCEEYPWTGGKKGLFCRLGDVLLTFEGDYVSVQFPDTILRVADPGWLLQGVELAYEAEIERRYGLPVCENPIPCYENTTCLQ